MPVTIKSGQVKVKGTNGYVSVDALADSTTASRIAAINAAGTSQVEAVEAAGAEVMADIPSDYSTLSDEVSDLKSAINDFYNNMFSNVDLAVPVGHWENGLIDENGQEIGEIHPDWARTADFYAPARNESVNLIRNEPNINAIIIIEYNSSYTMTNRTIYSVGTGRNHYVTLEAGKYYRFAITTPNLVVDLNNMDTYCSIIGKTLQNRIGVDELISELSKFFHDLIDSFGTSARYNSANVTNSKTTNAIDWEITSNSAYIIFNDSCQASHKYALYYDLTGEFTNGNYEFDVRLFNPSTSSWATSRLASVSQTTGATVEGIAILDIPSDKSGYLAFDFTNKNGQTVEGSFYLYDVTGQTAGEISSIDFSSVGSHSVVFVNANGGGEENYWADKKVVFYGDSITAQNKYPTAVANYYGFSMVNAGVGGARISYRGSGDTDMSADSRLEALPTDADVVVIMGGTNDWGKIEIEQTLTYNNGFDKTKFKGGLAYIIKKIQEQCPNALLIVATLIGGRNETRAGSSPVVQYLPEADRFGQTDLDFRNAEIEVANLLNIQVCDTWSCGINGNNACTISDGVVTAGTIADTVHPTTDGAKMIADYIIGYFKCVHVD